MIDYVGGQEDLQSRLIRAIGPPRLRFGEDKLRMLRAVRFAAAFGFAIDAETAAAVREMARQITVVSPERIAMEMRRVLTEPGRVEGVRLLVELGLAAAVLPEIVPRDETSQARAQHALGVLGRLQNQASPWPWRACWPGRSMPRRSAVASAGNYRTRRSTKRPGWSRSRGVARGPLDALVEVAAPLAHTWAEQLAALHEASSPQGPEETAFCRELLAQPPDKLDPPPLLTGDDLRSMVSGPALGSR